MVTTSEMFSPSTNRRLSRRVPSRGEPSRSRSVTPSRVSLAQRQVTAAQKLVEQGYVLVPAADRGPQALAAHTKREVARWKQVVESAGIPRN